jgi:uncharacterized protein YxjI
MAYQYPLELTFKLFSLTPQISLVDQQGNSLFYVRQQLFRLKEVINIFADSQRTQELFTIRADRVIDFSARYNFTDRDGQPLGSVKRKGMKSLWKAHYDVFDTQGDQVIFTIEEENPWVKVMDALFAEIPVVGMFTGYLFNPAYHVNRPDGTLVMRLEKLPAFFSRIFTIKQMNMLNGQEESQVLLSLLMLLLLERNRG